MGEMGLIVPFYKIRHNIKYKNHNETYMFMQYGNFINIFD